jgi:uncharacterized membrane protein YgcG
MNAPRRALAYVALVVGVLLLCSATLPVTAFVYTTTLTATQPPGVFTGTDRMGGLYTACRDANNPNASTAGRTALTVLGSGMPEMLAVTVTSGQVYLAGYYNETSDQWLWSSANGEAPVAFASGPSATPMNSEVPRNWTAGYPMLDASGKVGTRKYIAYDADKKGWINVDGTSILSGVACESWNKVNIESKKKFPWWAILIIVLGSVVVIAVVIIVVVCCCCCKKKKRYTDDDDESSLSSSRSGSFSSSRSGSFSSRGTSYSGTTRSSSFSSRGSSYSGSSKSSGVTGSASIGSGGSYSSRGSSRSGSN